MILFLGAIIVEECIFCKIINKEIDSNILYEDDNFLAILDAFPSAFGHTLIIPKNHMVNLLDADATTLHDALQVAQYVTTRLSVLLDTSDFNILHNCGTNSGQVVNHFHIHIIPRYKDDGLNMTFNPVPFNKIEATQLLKEFKEVVL